MCGVPESIGASLILVTVMLKGGILAVSMPSETLMTISWVVPGSLSPGVPLSSPVEVSKAAHDGGFVTENVRLSCSLSSLMGTNRYNVSSSTRSVGVPEMVGGSLSSATVMVAVPILVLKAVSPPLAVTSIPVSPFSPKV